MSNAAIENTIPVGLQMIAATLNDLAEISMVKRWCEEYERAAGRKISRQRVLAAVGEGYDTLPEIAAQTGIPPATARRIIIELVGKNRLRSARTKNTNNRIEVRFELA